VSFDKFKNIKPKAVFQPEGTDSYFEALDKLEYKQNNKTISVISTVAAAVAIVVIVAIWAIIGRGIRQDADVVPGASYDPYTVTVTQLPISDELQRKISTVFSNDYFDIFLPAFDKDNPLTNEQLTEFCSWMISGRKTDNIITKEQMSDYVYNIFNIKTEFESDIQSNRMRLILMDFATYHPIQYMVSEEFADGKSVAVVALKSGSTVKYIRFVQKGELELEYIVSVTEEEDTARILFKNQFIKFSKCREIFDLVADYRIDAMPEFAEGEEPDINGVINYAVHLHIEDVKKENSTLPAEILSKVAKEKFGIEYDLGGQSYIQLEAKGIMDFPLAELMKYNETPTNEGTKVSATVAIHNIWPLVDYNCKSLFPDAYEMTKTEITQGVIPGDTVTNIIEFSYITKDGKTPDKFISCKRYTDPDEDFLAFF